MASPASISASSSCLPSSVRMSWMRTTSKLLSARSFVPSVSAATFSSSTSTNSSRGRCTLSLPSAAATTSKPCSYVIANNSSSSSSSSCLLPRSAGPTSSLLQHRGFAGKTDSAAASGSVSSAGSASTVSNMDVVGPASPFMNNTSGKATPKSDAWIAGGSSAATTEDIETLLSQRYWEKVFHDNKELTEQMWKRVHNKDVFQSMMNSPYKMDPKALDEINTKWYSEHKKHRGAEKAIDYAMQYGKTDPKNIDKDSTSITSIWREAKKLMLWQCTEELGGSSFREALNDARESGDGKRERLMLNELNKKTKEWLHKHKMQARTMRYVDTDQEYQARRQRTLREYSFIDYERFQNFMQVADDLFWYMDDENVEDEKGVTAPNYLLFQGQEEERVKRQLQETDLRKISHLLPEWWVIDEGRHVKRVAKGKIESFSVMVIAGDGNGMAAWSVGKSKVQEEATAKAIRGIRKNLMFLPLTESRTITSRVVGKHEKTRVHLWPRYSGFGITAGFIQMAIFGCFGIEDITSKVYGNNHPRHQVWATFHGLAQQKSLREIAIDRGANVYNLFEWNPTYRPRPPTLDEMDRRKHEVREMIVRMRNEHAWNNPRLDEGFAFSDKYLDNSSENTKKNLRPLLYSRHFRYADWLSSLKASGLSEEKIAEEVRKREQIIRPMKEAAFVQGIITKEQLEATGLPIELEDPIIPHATLNPLTDDTIQRSSLANRPTSPLNRALGELYKGRGTPKQR